MGTFEGDFRASCRASRGFLIDVRSSWHPSCEGAVNCNKSMTTPNDPTRPGEDPPLSPQEYGIHREDERAAAERAAASQRIQASEGQYSSGREAWVASCCRKMVAENPCAAVAVAFAAGLLAGTLISGDCFRH